MSRKLEMLKTIAQRFSDAGIVWALGASMLLYFKGIVSEFHDIDLMIPENDIAKAKTVLDGMGRRLPEKGGAGFATRHFLEYDIDGVGVDLMAGFAIVSGGRVHDCALKSDQISEYACLDGERIPLQSVALWRRYYELMGREEKVRLIDNFAESVSCE